MTAPPLPPRMTEHQALVIQRAANGPGLGGLKLEFDGRAREVQITTFSMNTRPSEVNMTDHQREHLRYKANRPPGIARQELSFRPFDLPEGYILVREWTTGVCEQPFEYGISPLGEASS